MALTICPFCTSGLRWNECICTFATAAGRMGMIEARKRFLSAGHTYASAGLPITAAAPVIDRPDRVKPARAKPVPASKIEELRDAVAFVHSEPFAPAGECHWCDRNREIEAQRRASNVKRVQAHRERKKGSTPAGGGR